MAPPADDRQRLRGLRTCAEPINANGILATGRISSADDDARPNDNHDSAATAAASHRVRFCGNRPAAEWLRNAGISATGAGAGGAPCASRRAGTAAPVRARIVGTACHAAAAVGYTGATSRSDTDRVA